MENKKRLEEALRVKLNQHKMLNNTLEQMISSDRDETLVNEVEREVKSTLDEIRKIKMELKSANEEVTYSTYKENDTDKGLYDSITKKTKVLNRNEYLDKVRDTADSRVQANRFLVDLDKALSIPEIMVSSVSFDLANNGVWVCIYDFIAEYEGHKFPIMEVLKYATYDFDFSIRHLDDEGNVIYVERYSKCNISEIYRDPIDYATNDFSKIQVFIKYENVDYEAAD